MATSQLIAVRYMDLLGEGRVEEALNYLADDIVYNTWMGVVYGKKNVTVFLRDSIRFLHHGRNFNRWKQVHHSFAPPFRPQTMNGNDARASLAPTEHREVHRYFDADGYDSQGYASFERDGTIASHAKFSTFHVAVRETVVLRNNRIVLVNVSKRA